MMTRVDPPTLPAGVFNSSVCRAWSLGADEDVVGWEGHGNVPAVVQHAWKLVSVQVAAGGGPWPVIGSLTDASGPVPCRKWLLFSRVPFLLLISSELSR